MRRRSIILLVFASAFCLAACGSNPVAPVPEGEGIVIYRDINFEGGSQALNGDERNLEEREGPCRRDSGDGDSVPTWGDCLSSVRINPGWTATFYVDDSWRGGSFTVTADVSNLNTVAGPCRGGGFSDCISSIRVSRVQ